VIFVNLFIKRTVYVIFTTLPKGVVKALNAIFYTQKTKIVVLVLVLVLVLVVELHAHLDLVHVILNLIALLPSLAVHLVHRLDLDDHVLDLDVQVPDPDVR